MLMSMKALTEAGRALAYDACASLDFSHALSDATQAKLEKARAAYLTPIVKGWCTEVAQEVASLGVQVHGGMGFIEETGAAQHFRDARILPIYEGTNGIQALDLVGRKTLMDNGAAAECVMGEIATAIEQAKGVAELSDMAEVMGLALEAAQESTRLLMESAPANPQFPATTAYNYMMLMGSLCGGWELLRAATAAQQQIAAGENDPYLSAKVLTAQFYMDQILPRCHSYAQMVAAGSDSTLAFTDEHLTSAFS